MSEYQYYEFRTVDQPLTEKDMRKLRTYSTRAVISPATFTNEYSWGDFRGDENEWMEKYFDAFLYFANWGTRVIQLSVPTSMLDQKTARQYCPGEAASVRQKNRKTILSFMSEDDYCGEWMEENSLSGIIPLRSELANGDYRALYLSWLLCAQNGELDDNCVEPPVPPGLKSLSKSLKLFAEFLMIDSHWISVAAQESQALKESKTAEQKRKLTTWLAKLPSNEKDEILAALMLKESDAAAAPLLQRFLKTQDKPKVPSKNGKRTVGELRSAVENLTSQDIAV